MPITRNINQIFNNDTEIEQLYTEYNAGTLDMNSLSTEQQCKLKEKIKTEQIKQMIFKTQTSTYKPIKRKLKFRFNS